MNWLVKNFLRGLVVVVPIAATVYLVYRAFVTIDRMLNLAIPGAGFVITIVLVTAVGALASNFLVKRLLRLTDALFTRAPIVRLVYGALRDLLEAFVGDRKRFDKPVSVAFGPDAGVKALGFITQADLSFLSLPGSVAVYLPFCYSMAGTLVLVPASQVTLLDTDAASVMALVISGGISRAA